ncbi:MAG: biopolymer transporter ExbD [Verrucomicrobiota bacterium]
MATLQSPRPIKRARLEIIPFIDIMFFLLATFMMVSLTLVQNHGIELQLPQSHVTHDLPDLEKPLTISIQADGSIYLYKDLVTLEELDSFFLQKASEDPQMRIVIQGDYQCEYGRVVEVFDLAKKRGLTKLIIRTRKVVDNTS